MQVVHWENLYQQPEPLKISDSIHKTERNSMRRIQYENLSDTFCENEVDTKILYLNDSLE